MEERWLDPGFRRGDEKRGRGGREGITEVTTPSPTPPRAGLKPAPYGGPEG